MNSKLKFDLTEDNDPCITFEIDRDSTDLRDKVASRFFQELGHTSRWLSITFENSTSGVLKGTIKPVSSIDTFVDEVKQTLEPYTKSTGTGNPISIASPFISEQSAVGTTNALAINSDTNTWGNIFTTKTPSWYINTAENDGESYNATNSVAGPGGFATIKD